MTEVPLPTPIYHITSITNLAHILTAGGMQCYSLLQAAQANYTNIAYGDIQARRAAKRIECGAGGTLHDYVPFYFAPRSPMLYTISRGNVPGYDEGQEPIVHIVSTAQAVEASGYPFAFTDGHAIVFPSRTFAHLSDLDRIDWEVMPQQYWHDNDSKYPDRKRKRQAEFLVHRFFPWDLVTEVAVISFNRRMQVEALLRQSVHKPQVVTRSEWYY